MRRVFADTLYWVALANPTDQWHNLARKAESLLADAAIVTTEEVLTEFLAALAGGGDYLRGQAVTMVNAILESAEIVVLPQSHDSFIGGLNLYSKRLDKRYSLTACVSMIGCKAERITEVLTNDSHFEQEGFTLLIVG